MKNVIIKTLAVLLTVWYSMSVIGFDVHTCSGSGRSFVTTFIGGLACEDIHPEHSCGHASCCHDSREDCCSHTGSSVKAKSCCSNDYRALDLTGTLSSNDHDHSDECSCGICPCVGFPVCEAPALFAEDYTKTHIQRPESGVGSACERQAALRVWRI